MSLYCKQCGNLANGCSSGRLLRVFHQVSHLDPGEHACSRNAEVQISYHLCCGRFIDLWRPTARKVIWKEKTQHTENKVNKIILGDNEKSSGHLRDLRLSRFKCWLMYTVPLLSQLRYLFSVIVNLSKRETQLRTFFFHLISFIYLQL